MELTRKDIEAGDTVEITCPQLLNNINKLSKVQGIVLDVFDALNPDGSEGNLEIEIKYDDVKWLKYKPLLDGGSIVVLKKGI